MSQGDRSHFLLVLSVIPAIGWHWRSHGKTHLEVERLASYFAAFRTAWAIFCASAGSAFFLPSTCSRATTAPLRLSVSRTATLSPWTTYVPVGRTAPGKLS